MEQIYKTKEFKPQIEYLRLLDKGHKEASKRGEGLKLVHDLKTLETIALKGN